MNTANFRRRFIGVLPVWAESNTVRPSGQNNFPYDIVLYRVEP